jgi:hypothetical protein
MRATFNMWRQRGLTLLGRAQVAKAQGISLVQHISMAIAIPTKVCKEIDDLMFKFIWKSQDRINRRAMLSDDARSLKLLEARTMNDAHLLQWLSAAEDTDHPWKDFLQEQTIEAIFREGNKTRKYYKPPENLEPFHLE